MKYHILFTKKTTLKATSIKNSCIAKTKTMNKIQCTKTQKNYVVLLYIFICC